LRTWFQLGYNYKYTKYLTTSNNFLFFKKKLKKLRIWLQL